jgi:ABC-type sugar transport system permease subunit
MFSSASIREALSKFFRLDSLADNLSGYVEARVELLKLEVREEVARAMTRVMVLGAIIVLGILCIVFASLGLALYLNEYFDGRYTGFFLMGLLYLILFVLSMVMRKQLFQSLERLLTNHLKHHKQ